MSGRGRGGGRRRDRDRDRDRDYERGGRGRRGGGRRGDRERDQDQEAASPTKDVHFKIIKNVEREKQEQQRQLDQEFPGKSETGRPSNENDL